MSNLSALATSVWAQHGREAFEFKTTVVGQLQCMSLVHPGQGFSWLGGWLRRFDGSVWSLVLGCGGFDRDVFFVLTALLVFICLTLRLPPSLSHHGTAWRLGFVMFSVEPHFCNFSCFWCSYLIFLSSVRLETCFQAID